MPHAEKWIPSPWNKRELELRRIKDAKNKRERKRKDKKQDGELLAAAELWTAEAVDEQHDVSAEPEQGPFYMFPFYKIHQNTNVSFQTDGEINR